MMRTKILLFSSLFLVFLASPATKVAAESSDRIANLSISVWPEYDDPSVLVIYDGQFADKDGYPRQVGFLVPSDANVNATAYGDDNGGYLNTDPWKTEDAGNGWTRILFNLPRPAFHIEFYYNPLQGKTDKTMSFAYKSAQPADTVELEIQQPLKAINFKTEPVAVLQTTRGHDFKYHVFHFSNVTVGQLLSVQVSYTKTDPNPSVASITIPSDATSANATNIPSSNLLLPAGIGAAGLALLALGFLAWRARGGKEERSQPRRAHNKKKGQSFSAFCHECGNGLRAEDVFCSHCGTKRKS
jgi:zinc ribbon protein